MLPSGSGLSDELGGTPVLYLTRKRKPRVAHLWDGEDTYCRMHSTGGLNPEKFGVSSSAHGLPICAMCQHVREDDEAVTIEAKAKEIANLLAEWRPDLDAEEIGAVLVRSAELYACARPGTARHVRHKTGVP